MIKIVGNILCIVLVCVVLIISVALIVFASLSNTTDNFFVASKKIIPIRPP
ncbi:MAG: hypothetical protein PHH12_03080 [Candidatus Shapirobacteria bacterium]|nr:hypothetical protein [Candidatus Shapirobacteria bacterium]